MIKRHYDNLESWIKENRVLVIYGPRRVGKTTLLRQYLEKCPWRYRLESGDNIKIQDILSSEDFERILGFAENYKLIAIDEAQRIPKVGMGLKILVDEKEGIVVIATGSSSFDLSQQIGEPLTGRKTTITLFPIAQKELLARYNRQELSAKLPEYLIYGSYPDVVNAETRTEKIKVLEELVESYLLKDILSLERVKSPKVLMDLLKLLSFQIGRQVSNSELATQLMIDAKTVERYLDLLEKSFIIKRLGAFSRNQRKELRTKSKYIFLDNGIRNAVISQYNGIADRSDVGELFENFVISERIKKRSYDDMYGAIYFWRNYDGQEIDYIEESDGVLRAYEVKWSVHKQPGVPTSWAEAYSDAEFRIINSENYLDFLS